MQFDQRHYAHREFHMEPDELSALSTEYPIGVMLNAKYRPARRSRASTLTVSDGGAILEESLWRRFWRKARISNN